MVIQPCLCTSHGPPSLHRTALLQARPRLLLPVQSLVCLAAFGLALPLAISLFPQMSEVSGGKGQGREEPFINKDLTCPDCQYRARLGGENHE